MKNTATTPRRQSDANDALDMFSPEREARARGDGFDGHDVIRPDSHPIREDAYAYEALPWHEDSAEAMRRAAFVEWRNRVLKLSFAGALVAGVLFLIPLFQSGSLSSWWRSAELVMASLPTGSSQPEVTSEPKSDTSTATVAEPPVVPAPDPSAPPPRVEPAPQTSVEPLPPTRVEPVPPARVESAPRVEQTPRVEPPRLAQPPPRNSPVAPAPRSSTAVTSSTQSGRAGEPASQTSRLGLAPPQSQTGVNPSTPATRTPAASPPSTASSATAAPEPAPRPSESAPTAPPRTADPAPVAAPRPPDPAPPATAADATSTQRRNVPLIGERNVPIVRDRNVPLVGDRNVPRTADRTAAPPVEPPATRPGNTAPPVSPPAASPSNAAPTPPSATPAPSPAPAPPPSTAAAAPSPAAAAATTAVAPPAAAVTRSAAASPPALELDQREINGALARYKGAFNALDARAAASVWPTVDRDTLARAFQRLRQQEVAFDACQIDVKDTRASATCNGTLRFVPRVGTSTPQVDRRQWKFGLAKVRDEWVIQSVDTR